MGPTRRVCVCVCVFFFLLVFVHFFFSLQYFISLKIYTYHRFDSDIHQRQNGRVLFPPREVRDAYVLRKRVLRKKSQAGRL